MDKLSFEIFTPDEKKFRLTPNWIVLILWGATIAFLYLFDSVLPPNSSSRSTLVWCVMIITFYYLISSFWKYEPLNGILNGRLEFKNDTIIINNKSFQLKDINNLDFQFVDYYGKRSSGIGRDFSPKFSSGVGNYVTFTDSTNQTQIVYFKIESENGYQSLAPFINEAIRNKKMEFKHGIDLVGIENISID